MNAGMWVSISGLALYLIVWGVTQRHHRAIRKMSDVRQATGDCSIEVMSQQVADASAEPVLVRVYGGKEFHGALEGFSKREALNILDREAGPSHVTAERVTGTLHGRSGSFLLIHSHPLDEGVSFVVVPGSGTGDLIGISGTMRIGARKGGYFYEFEYALNAPKPRLTLLRKTRATREEQQGNMGHVVNSTRLA